MWAPKKWWILLQKYSIYPRRTARKMASGKWGAGLILFAARSVNWQIQSRSLQNFAAIPHSVIPKFLRGSGCMQDRWLCGLCSVQQCWSWPMGWHLVAHPAGSRLARSCQRGITGRATRPQIASRYSEVASLLHPIFRSWTDKDIWPSRRFRPIKCTEVIVGRQACRRTMERRAVLYIGRISVMGRRCSETHWRCPRNITFPESIGPYP